MGAVLHAVEYEAGDIGATDHHGGLRRTSVADHQPLVALRIGQANRAHQRPVQAGRADERVDRVVAGIGDADIAVADVEANDPGASSKLSRP